MRKQPITRYPYLLIMAIMFSCLLSAPVRAGTVTIDAGKMHLIQEKGRVEFFNNVHLIREGMELNCDHLIAWYDEHRLKRAEADGHVVIIQDKVRGHAKHATLDQAKNTLTLKGKAVLEQDGNRIEGETIVHHLNRKETVVTPVEGGRIHMSIESEETVKQ